MSKITKGRRLINTLVILAAACLVTGVFLMSQENQENPGMFRKNVSKAEWQTNAKAKMNMAVVYPWFPAMKADDSSAAPLEYYDADGILMRTETMAKPIVVTYTQETGPGGEHDVYAAVSRDDGATYKRKNLSHMAEKSSFTLENGTEYFGHCVKPVMTVKGNKIIVAWTSKYAKGGRPRYAIDKTDGYAYDDPYWVDDIWGVGGQQQSVDYLEVYDLAGIGEVPFSAVWVARGVIASASDVAKGVGSFVGDVVWFKPERLTSARRDALQIATNGGDGAGFGVVWQEDPVGLNPGHAKGPGDGWSGAITNKTTDIWYSWIKWEDFNKIDTHFESSGEPQYDPLLKDPDFAGRPKGLVPMSLPVRISDNEVINTRNTAFFDASGNYIPGTGTNLEDTDGDGIPDTGIHRYFSQVPNLWSNNNPGNPFPSDLGQGFFDYYSSQGAPRTGAVTKDLRLMSGKTSASRANLMMQPFKKPDGTKSAYALVIYEETHGNGTGAPDWGGEGSGEDPELDEDEHGPNDRTYKDEGKNVIYHTFEFTNPDVVSGGTIINYPEGVDCSGNGTPGYLILEDGSVAVDWMGNPVIAYENARRPRLVLQGKSAVGSTRTIAVILYKEGEKGQGRPSDIMMRRIVTPNGDTGNPYKTSNLVPGFRNVSTVTPLVLTSASGTNESDDRLKVLEWEQPEENLMKRSGVNPYEEARAHRGSLKGDFLTIGYTYTPNWAASRNYNDKYNFYIRRSFDGGRHWTTDPKGKGIVEHTEIFLDPEAADPADRHFEVYETFAPGEYEPARNVSLLKNNFESVIEPRIVGPPGSISGSPRDEDLQNTEVVYFSYGTEANDETQVPLDLFWSFTADSGQTLLWSTWVPTQGPNVGVTQVRWPWLATSGGKAHESEEEGEAQLRELPSGERMYASWLQEGPDEYGSWTSDIYMRRIIPFHFLPESWILFPKADNEIFGTHEFLAEAYDDRPLESVMFSLREPFQEEVEGVPEEELADIGYEEMPAIQDDPETPEMWKLMFDTTQLHDGPFVLMTKATDRNGNVRWSDGVPFIVHNLEIISRLPSSTNNKAGRTMPVKFALKMRDVVDPDQAFVYNDGLVVNVFKKAATLDAENELLQTFVFGEGDDYYRIDTVDEIYIANFQTLEELAEYIVEVRQLSNDWLLGTLFFETLK